MQLVATSRLAVLGSVGKGLLSHQNLSNIVTTL